MSRNNSFFAKHIILRNIVVLILFVTAIMTVMKTSGLTEFYSKSAFASCAEIYHNCNDTEHRGNKWRNHTVGIGHLSSRYTFKGAILDLSPYEDEEYPCIGGVTNIEIENISDADLLKHLLIINPADHVINISGFAGIHLNVYTDSEYAISVNNELLPAERFFEAEAEFNEIYGSFADILKNDYEYLLYNLFQRNFIVLIAISVLSGIYLLYNNRKTLEGIIFNYNSISDMVIGFYYICGVVMMIGIAAMTVFSEDMQSHESLMDILGMAVLAITCLAALIIILINIVMYITEQKIIVAVSRFIWRFLLPVGAGILAFGLGLIIYEFAEAYAIIKTALAIALIGFTIYMILMLIAILLKPFESIFKVANSFGAAIASGSNADKDLDVSGLNGGEFDMPAIIYDKNDYAYTQSFVYSDRAVYVGPHGERATLYFKHVNNAGFAITENNRFHW